MISVQTPPKISYIGPCSEVIGKKIVNSYEDMLSILLNDLKYNINLDIYHTCLDVSFFSFSQSFFESPIDEESELTSSLINNINKIVTKGTSKIFFYIGKDYFLGTQLEDVKNSTILLIDRLSEILDLIGVNYPSIMVRIGSAYGNRKNTMNLFCERLSLLSNSSVKKMCVMNDEKPSLFSITDLLSGVYYKSGIPICFRLLPHQFNDGGLSIREALFLSCSTWKSGNKPFFIHGESVDLDNLGFSQTPKTSSYLKNRIPTFGLDLDVIIDSPAREDSCLKYIMEYRSLKPIVINKKF